MIQICAHLTGLKHDQFHARPARHFADILGVVRESIKHIQQAFLALCLIATTVYSHADVVSHDVAFSDADLFESDAINTKSNSPLRVQFSAMGQDLSLRLTPSRFNRLAQKHNIAANDFPRLMQGVVEGAPDSWARISVHDGKISGSVFYANKLLQLENRSQVKHLLSDDQSNSEYVFLEPAISNKATSILNELYGAVDKIRYAPEYKLKNTSNAPIPIDQRVITRSTDALGTGVTRVLRIGIYIDSRYNELHGNRGLANALDIIHSVDAIYQAEFGIAIIVEGISDQKDPALDPMRDKGGTVDQIMENFRQVRIDDELLPDDLTLVHLFSGHNDPERVIGLGWVNVACRLDGYDLSMSTPFTFATLLAAHEMAHNLGALHDTEPHCNTEGTQAPDRLMWPRLSRSSQPTFSNCSKESIQLAKNASCNHDNIDVDIRLRTYPTSESLRRSVVVDVTNKDPHGRAAELSSSTQFPEGTQFVDMSAGCTVYNYVVDCVHGEVQAGSTHSTAITAELLSQSTERVFSNVKLQGASDILFHDNRAQSQLLQFDTRTGEAIASVSAVNPIAQSASAQDDFVSNIGAMSLWWWFTGVLIWLQRVSFAYRLKLNLGGTFNRVIGDRH